MQIFGNKRVFLSFHREATDYRIKRALCKSRISVSSGENQYFSFPNARSARRDGMKAVSRDVAATGYATMQCTVYKRDANLTFPVRQVRLRGKCMAKGTNIRTLITLALILAYIIQPDYIYIYIYFDNSLYIRNVRFI